jgi:uncharacterized membrane protein
MPEIIPNWHPMFVHFTVALLSLSVVLYVIIRFMHSPLRDQWLVVARWCLWFGAGFTVLTVLTGVYAYNTVEHDTPSHLAMTEHRNLALMTAAAFLLLAGFSAWRARQGNAPRQVFVLALVIASGLLASTAWHGGELVYRHGLGVMSLPETGGEGHVHDHGDGHTHEHDAGHAEVPSQAQMPPADTSAVEAKPPQADEMNMDFSGMEEGMEDKESDHDHAGHDHEHSH